MHEYSVAQALYDKVAAEAAARHATRIHEVHVRIGHLSGVDVGLLDTAWRTFRVNTICDTAPMQVNHVAGDDLILERIVMEVP
jgi:hydrogenase nickel incorporation protein HypA/HybF